MKLAATLLLAAAIAGQAFPVWAQATAAPVETSAPDALSLRGLLFRLDADGLTPEVTKQWTAFDANWSAGEGRTPEGAADVLTDCLGWVFERNGQAADPARLVLPLLRPLGQLPEPLQRGVMERALAASNRARVDRNSLAYLSIFPGGARDVILDWHLANSSVSEALTMEVLVEQKLHGTSSPHADERLGKLAEKYLPAEDDRSLTSFEIQALFVRALLNEEHRKPTRERFKTLAAGLPEQDERVAQLHDADDKLSRPRQTLVPQVVTDFEQYKASLKPGEPAMTFAEYHAKWTDDHASPADFGIEEAPLPGS